MGLMKVLLVLAVLLSACAASPVAPSQQPAFYYPPALQPVIALIDRDPWIHPLIGEPAGVWVRRYVRGIEIDPSLLNVPHGAQYHWERRVILWSPRELDTEFEWRIMELAGLLLHEARHGEGYRHTCPDGIRDRSMNEGGAFAVQILWLEHWNHSHLNAIAGGYRQYFIGC
jgi:hypothetical protein